MLANPGNIIDGLDFILVVDDDEAVREALKFVLEIEGLQVQACAGGRAVLERNDLAHASCLVLDYQMPGMDGFELLERLAEKGFELPTIMIAAQVGPALARRAKRAGIRHLLEKPLMDSALLEGIQDVLAGR